MATGDAVAMFEAARSMVDRGTLDVPAHQSSEAWRGRDGRYYTPFGIGQSLFDVPFLVAGRTAARVTGIRIGDPDTLPKAFVAAASTIPAAVAVGFGLLDRVAAVVGRAIERADSARPRVRDAAVAVRQVRLQCCVGNRDPHVWCLRHRRRNRRAGRSWLLAAGGAGLGAARGDPT